MLLGGAALAAACGSDNTAGPAGAKGISCTVVQNPDGSATVKCEDGTSANVQVPAPPPGVTCTAADDGKGTKTITCSDGTTFTISDGKNGTGGTNGDAGANGTNGLSVAITAFHGVDFLEKEMMSTANKYFVEISNVSATAAADGKVTVNYTVKDKAGKVVTGIVGSTTSYTIAKLVPPVTNEAATRWVPYIWRTETVSGNTYPKPDGTKAEQAYRENNGTFTDHGDGTYTYVFATNIAAVTRPVSNTAVTYERSRKHRVAIMMGGHSGPTGTATFDFVPDGTTTDTTSRDILSTSSCKSCHGPFFAGHGGDRLTVENCVTCHVPGSTDAQSGNTLDFKVMIHKIHAGAELASVPGPDGIVLDDPATVADESADNGHYVIYGYNNTKVEWYDVGFPAKVENCTKCHNGTGAQVDNWKANPSRDACGSCHDLTSFTGTATPPMELHPGGVQTSDVAGPGVSGCNACHGPAGAVPAWRVDAVHDFMTKDPREQMEYIPEISVTLPDGTAPAGGFFVAGQTPMVTIKLKDAENPANPYIDHTTMIADDAVTAVPPGDGPEGCTVNAAKTACVEAKDGKFTSAKLFVHGPRARRVPVLSTLARVVMKSTLPGTQTFNFSRTDALGLKIDSGKEFFETDSSGGDVLVPGTFNVTAYGTSASGQVAASPAPTTTAFTDASQLALGTSLTWRDHQLAGSIIIVTDNTDTAKPTATGTVLDNVGAQVTLTSTMAMLTNGHILSYAAYAPSGSYSAIATGGSTTTLVDAAARPTVAAAWSTDRYKGWTVSIIKGTGSGQKATITGNDATTLSFAALGTAPDATSVYTLTPWANAAAVTVPEVINWLNANSTFRERAIAYTDDTFVGSTLAAAASASATTFTVKAGDGALFPSSGTVVLDRTLNQAGSLVGSSETLAYTRTGDVFTVPALTFAHSNKASVFVAVPSALAIRSRNRGDVFSIQSPSASSNTLVAKLFPADVVWGYPVRVLGSNTPGATVQTGTASTVGNNIARQTDPTKNDPSATWTAGSVTYLLDPVDDLQPGTYVADIEILDRGSLITDVNFKSPTVVRVAFQVGTATEEKAPANNCGTCHTDPTDTKGYVLDFTRHRKLFNNTAVDQCGNCHDYQPQNATGATWSGAVPIARRVHAVHNGASLNYPNTTVSHADGEGGRNWDIVMPIDLRTCDVTCHTSKAPFNTTATSGTWKTKPARLPCGGCHDSAAAQAHFKAMTWDPTPSDPYSGDESESCAACHASP